SICAGGHFDKTARHRMGDQSRRNIPSRSDAQGKSRCLGKYTVAGDTMTIQEVHGKTPKSCKKSATYKFSRNGDELTFTKVSDTCKLREKHVLQTWKPWKAK